MALVNVKLTHAGPKSGPFTRAEVKVSAARRRRRHERLQLRKGYLNDARQ